MSSRAADLRYIHCREAASRWQLCNPHLLPPSPSYPFSARARAHTHAHTHTHTHTRLHARTHLHPRTHTPLVNPDLSFPAKLSHTSTLLGNPSLPSFAKFNEATRSRPRGEMCQQKKKKKGKETLVLCKIIKYLSGLRYIFNNPINTKNSFECLLALGKTLFPRQIALNF